LEGRVLSKQKENKTFSAKIGCHTPDNDKFDAELVETVVSKLNRRKAAGLGNVTSHCRICNLQYGHPLYVY